MIIKSTEDIVLRYNQSDRRWLDYQLCHYEGTHLIYMEMFKDDKSALEAFEVRAKKQKENNVSST